MSSGRERCSPGAREGMTQCSSLMPRSCTDCRSWGGGNWNGTGTGGNWGNWMLSMPNKTEPIGNLSTTRIPEAALGPALEIVSVKVTISPNVPFVRSADLYSARSAPGALVSCTTEVEVLLVRLGS